MPIGPWTIDLETLELDASYPVRDEKSAASDDVPKVAYSARAAALFDRAAAIARSDGAERVEAVHMLVAFAPDDEGVMGRLKSTYGFTATAWRAALVDWEPPARRRAAPSSTGLGSRSPGSSESPDVNERSQALRDKLLLSPDEAAELLGVHTQTVRGYIRDGKLKAHRVAGERAIRIRREDLLALLEPYDQGD